MTNLLRVSPPAPSTAPGRRGYLVRGTIPPVFVERGALAPEQAIAFTPAAGQTREWERLRGIGAIRQTGANWWLDIVAYHAAANARSRAALPWLVLGAVLIAAIAVSFYRG